MIQFGQFTAYKEENGKFTIPDFPICLLGNIHGLEITEENGEAQKYVENWMDSQNRFGYLPRVCCEHNEPGKPPKMNLGFMRDLRIDTVLDKQSQPYRAFVVDLVRLNSWAVYMMQNDELPNRSIEFNPKEHRIWCLAMGLIDPAPYWELEQLFDVEIVDPYIDGPTMEIMGLSKGQQITLTCSQPMGCKMEVFMAETKSQPTQVPPASQNDVIVRLQALEDGNVQLKKDLDKANARVEAYGIQLSELQEENKTLKAQLDETKTDREELRKAKIHKAIEAMGPIGEKRLTPKQVNHFCSKVEAGMDLEVALDTIKECFPAGKVHLDVKGHGGDPPPPALFDVIKAQKSKIKSKKNSKPYHELAREAVNASTQQASGVEADEDFDDEADLSDLDDDKE